MLPITIVGRDLPGRRYCEPDGTPLPNVHVAVQVGAAPVGLVAGDAPSARWELEVRVVELESGGFDFKGAAVHGRRGERFLYLTWGDVAGDGSFRMFRRAKLILDDVEPALLRAAVDDRRPLVATVDLTDDRGGPRCARVRPPAVSWE
jgi:Family of unknown function (DUF5990)